MLVLKRAFIALKKTFRTRMKAQTYARSVNCFFVITTQCSEKLQYKLYYFVMMELMHSGGYSNSKVRGKDFQKLMFSKKEKELDLVFTFFSQNHGDL